MTVLPTVGAVLGEHDREREWPVARTAHRRSRRRAATTSSRRAGPRIGDRRCRSEGASMHSSTSGWASISAVVATEATAWSTGGFGSPFSGGRSSGRQFGDWVMSCFAVNPLAPGRTGLRGLRHRPCAVLLLGRVGRVRPSDVCRGGVRQTWRGPGVVSSSRAPGVATQLRVPAPFKSADQSSYHRVLPLNYRAVKRRRPDSSQHSKVFVRTRSIWQSVAMLKLERESECDRGCLCHVGPPR